MKKIKKNISKLFLFVCLGLTLTSIVYASTRYPIDVPSAPGSPEVTDIWNDGCTLEYRAPIYDGGSPVTSYIIESRTYKWIWLSWQRKGVSKTLKYKVSNMIEGSEAQFRVIAVNEAGEGVPSEPSNLVMFKYPFN